MPDQSRKIKIFVNASTVKIGGGLILSLNIIQKLAIEESFKIVVSYPGNAEYTRIGLASEELIKVPPLLLLKFSRIIHDFIWIRRKINSYSPDIVLSLGNLPIPTKRKQIYLHDNPFMGLLNYRKLNLDISERILAKLRSRLSLIRLKYVHEIWIQTNYQYQKIKRMLPADTIVRIVPPILRLSESLDSGCQKKLFPESGKVLKLLCPSRYYSHKNLEILLSVGELIFQKNIPVKIYVTIESSQHKKAGKLISEISKKKEFNTIFNLGAIASHELPSYLQQSDAVLLPTLLESFSLIIVESWFYKKPLIISDIPENRDICDDTATFFNPFDTESILNAIKQLILNKRDISYKISRGFKRYHELSMSANYEEYIKESVQL